MGTYLAEIPESAAEGRVAELYDDIRDVLRLPLVNLVYRHLAAIGRLEDAWRQLRPNLTHPAIDEGAEELVELASTKAVAPVSRAALAAAGAEQRLPRAIATLDAYNHANPRNLLALLGLLQGATGREDAAVEPGRGGSGETPGAESAAMLPIAALDGLPPETRALLDEMAGAFATRGEAALVPGLFRHFAHDPALLALLWTVLLPLARGSVIARNGNVVARRAAAIAGALPFPVSPTEDADTRAVLERFTATIPRMVVAGVALRQALPAG